MPGTEPQRQDFQTGWPRFYKDCDGVPVQFEVKLSEDFLRKIGLSDSTFVAYVDDSTQYQAGGLCWRAASACGEVRQGQRLESEDVAGWRIPTRQVGTVVASRVDMAAEGHAFTESHRQYREDERLKELGRHWEESVRDALRV